MFDISHLSLFLLYPLYLLVSRQPSLEIDMKDKKVFIDNMYLSALWGDYVVVIFPSQTVSGTNCCMWWAFSTLF